MAFPHHAPHEYRPDAEAVEAPTRPVVFRPSRRIGAPRTEAGVEAHTKVIANVEHPSSPGVGALFLLDDSGRRGVRRSNL